MKTADGSTTQQSFTSHPTGLLNEATFPGGTLTNEWDAGEHRVKFTAVGGSAPGYYTFVFDPTAGIPAVLQENTPGGTVEIEAPLPSPQECSPFTGDLIEYCTQYCLGQGIRLGTVEMAECMNSCMDRMEKRCKPGPPPRIPVPKE